MRKRWLLKWLAFLAAVGLSVLVIYAAWLSLRVQQRFDGQRYNLPGRIHARALEIYPGANLSLAEFEAELELGRYRLVDRVTTPGTYERSSSALRLHTRAFAFADGMQPSQIIQVAFTGRRVASIEDAVGAALPIFRLDPPLIASLYPDSGEDRELLSLADAPAELIAGLLAVEDRRFLAHRGVDWRALGRAMLTNLRAGRIAQGGSTITQQLAKNLFLTRERTIRRKVDEALMAGVLEWHYSKEQILEAYANAVYLGQDGNRAIHGFALGAQHFFGQPLNQLDLHQHALLIGLVKGPSYYHPRRHPERALARRNLALDAMLDYGVIDQAAAERAKSQGLDVLATPPPAVSAFAAYIDIVREQLTARYSRQALRQSGLRFMTALEPRLQSQAQQALEALPAGLQGAVVVVEPHTGEIRALAGGRGSTSFNRALHASRQVGSVFKPLVYLAALDRPADFTLATQLDDSQFTLNTRDGPWTPRNHDGVYHGPVLLIEALAQSYNAATARLAQTLGMRRVYQQIDGLGVDLDAPANPSAALGAIEMTPLEVAQTYQPLAAGGYPAVLSAVRTVLDAQGALVESRAIELDEIDNPEIAYLLTAALVNAVTDGTGQALARLTDGKVLAGKTGTTNAGRDAWFVGYGSDLLVTVWVGRDDNQPANVGGSRTALPVAAQLLRLAEDLDMSPPPGIDYVEVDSSNGLLAGATCAQAIELPFVQGSAPTEFSPCAARQKRGFFEWLKDRFD